ncbi:hypothetical protein BU17DRAFT_78779 [Hysterangium stoloniferum]|nr:hypothetical protein BU17DRAFT_78779 [Hysterangium stoloniferum]
MALKRLSGHESDVTDIAWSPDDGYLASVGLDSMVILIQLESHQGFIKGVCWDPAGEFLATQVGGARDSKVAAYNPRIFLRNPEMLKTGPQWQPAISALSLCWS